MVYTRRRAAWLCAILLLVMMAGVATVIYLKQPRPAVRPILDAGGGVRSPHGAVPEWLRPLEDMFGPFKRFESAREVYLPAEGSTQGSLDSLRGVAGEMETLTLDGEGFTDHSLEGLKSVAGIETLNVHSPRVTSTGLRHLRPLQRLRFLTLDQCWRIGDEGMPHLLQLRSLEILDLGGTQVTDAGLLVLGKSKTLKAVDVSETAVTQTGRDRLLKLRPTLRVSGDEPNRELLELLQQYSQAIESDPRDGDLFYNRGLRWGYLGEYDKAVADYTEAIHLNPDNAAAYNNRGVLYREFGRFSDALTDFGHVLELDSKNAAGYLAYINRGRTFRAMGDLEAALEDHNSAVALSPGGGWALNERGLTLSALEKYAEALSDFTEAIHDNIYEADYYYNRGTVHEALRDYNSAIHDYGWATQLDRRHAQAYKSRGTAFEAIGQQQRAEEDFRRVEDLELAPERDRRLRYSAPPSAVFDILSRSGREFSEPLD